MENVKRRKRIKRSYEKVLIVPKNQQQHQVKTQEEAH